MRFCGCKSFMHLRRWFMAVWFLYPSFTAHCTMTLWASKRLRGESNESEALHRNYTQLSSDDERESARVILCATVPVIISYTKRIRILICDLWLMVKKSVFMSSPHSPLPADPFWWFLHEKCTLKCHNKLWDSQLHPSNKLAPVFLCVCAFLSPFLRHQCSVTTQQQCLIALHKINTSAKDENLWI